MRSLNVLLAVLVSVCIGLGVLELGLRLIPAFAPPAKLVQFDSVTGWSKIPGKSITRRVAGEKIRFETNEHGLRDDAGVGPGKEAGTFRVLMLGDSFVQGYTVNRPDLFVDQLEGWWKSEERRVDVVNAGTEAWSTDQEVAWFLANAKEYEPDLVMLFPYENDLFWNGQPAYETGQQKPLFPTEGAYEPRELTKKAQRSWLSQAATVGFARITLGWLQLKLKGPPEMRPEFGVLLNTPPPGYDEWVARTRNALAILRDACKHIGARLIVCPIPSKSAVDPVEREFFRTWDMGLNGLPDDQWSPDRPVNQFRDLATGLGIELVDPRAALAAATKQATEGKEKLYFEGKVEWHFNAHGNKVFATWLHDELDRLEVFPPEHAARAQGAIPPHPTSGGVPAFLYVFACLWAFLGTAYCVTYPKEPKGRGVLSVGAMLGAVFTIVLGGGKLVGLLHHTWVPWIAGGFVVVVLGFVAWKLGRRLGTVLELLRSFTLRGHWYLMPLVVVLLTIGSLLVVAASSPLIAPFIYTLF
jgi:lysophospholipase L1-like esterase